MRNFSDKELEIIKTDSDLLYNIYSESDNWVKSYLRFEEKDRLSRTIKKDRSKISSIKSTIRTKPVFAIFGISQVGKSYLVQNFLSRNGSSLEIIAGSNRIDFLGSVNPVGGAESTGVVSRFTVEPALGTSEFPISAKLFSPRDILLIIADTFFSDVSSLESYSGREVFAERLQEYREKFSNQPAAQSALTEDDIWIISTYFRDNFINNLQNIKEIESSGYWTGVGEIITRIPSQEWLRLFEPIWNSDKELNRIFSLLVKALENLGFPGHVYLQEDAILREKGAILDVSTLDRLFEESGLPVYPVLKPGGEKKTITGPLLSALIAEIVLNVDPALAEEKEFLNSTDLLDFPGARSRSKNDASSIDEEVAVKMFLRGKVAYLFNKYSADYEVNNLLFCIKDTQTEVTEISGILNNWIVNNVGENREERARAIGQLPVSPLFVVFTFFNEQLKFDVAKDNHSLDYRWENRFIKIFEKEFSSTFQWHKDWTSTEPNFKNFFLLRDYKYSQDTFIQEAGIEIEIKSERKIHLERVRDSFLNHSFVQSHFDNPARAWDMAAMPGYDGSDYILKSLAPAAGNFMKTVNFCNQLQKFRDDILKGLEPWRITDNLIEKRKKAFRESTELGFDLLNLFSLPGFNFAEFLDNLSVTEVESYSVIHDNYLRSQKSQEPEHYRIFRMEFPEISGENSKDLNLELIARKLRMDSITEAEQYLISKGINLEHAIENRVQTNASRLVDLVLEHWADRMNIDRFEKFTAMGLKKTALTILVNNLQETFKSMNVRMHLIELFEQKTKLINPPADTEEYMASISSQYINDFVSNFGFNFMNEDRIREIFQIAEEFHLDVKLLKIQGEEPDSLSPEIIYEHADSMEGPPPPVLDNFRAYITKMKLAMISNCGFARYNQEMASSLNNLLNRLEQLNFKLN
jgi:hypothetical protein